VRHVAQTWGTVPFLVLAILVIAVREIRRETAEGAGHLRSGRADRAYLVAEVVLVAAVLALTAYRVFELS